MALELEKTYDLLRVYFNSHATAPFVWSIDNGNQENETNVPHIVAQGAHRYEYNGERANSKSPVAWVEYRGAKIHRIGDSDELFIENDTGY